MTLLQTVAPASQPQTWVSLILPVGMVLLFYIFLIRPQSQARKAMEARLSKIQVGDDVVLSSGLFATVERLDAADSSIVYLKLGSNVIKARRQAIVAFANESPEKS